MSDGTQPMNIMQMGNLPPEIYQQQQELNRQQQMAQLLMQQGQQSPQGRMVGNRYVAPSFTQNLASLAQTGVGAYLQNKGDKQALELATKLREGKLGTQQALMEALNAGDTKKALSIATADQYGAGKEFIPALIGSVIPKKTDKLIEYETYKAEGGTKKYNDWAKEITPEKQAQLDIDRQRLGLEQRKFNADYGVQGGSMPQGGMQPVALGSPIMSNPNMPSYAQGTPVAGMNIAPVNTAGLFPKDVRGIQVGLAKETAEAQQAKITSAFNMAPAIKEIETLLPNSTSGGVKTLLKEGYEYTSGKPTTKSGVDARLGVLGAKLVAEVPRFKGADSDKDVAQYKAAAGDVANTKVPWQSRMAALQTIKDLNAKYAPDVYKDMMTPAAPATPPAEAPRTSLSNTWQIINRK
jgi:hypothetical protein